MIDKKLDKLGKYVEEMDRKKPFVLLIKYINQLNEEFETINCVKSEIERDFENEIIKIVNSFREKGLSNSIISYSLYNMLINFIKNSIMEKKAGELEIDRTLYKQEMRILFKGKWK